MVRINKYLASCDLGSRRSVETLIRDGKVSINDVVCTDLATTIDPEKDIIKVGHKKIVYKPHIVFIMLNKPRKYMVTRKDEFQRKTVYDLLPEFASQLHPIGRLDYESEGLLLLTNDGNITNKIIHPSAKIEKTYKVIVKGKITMDKIVLLRNGIHTPDFKTQPAKVFLKHATDEMSELKIIITEGKNRQVRKMMEAIHHEVISLKRLQIGEIKLDKLPTGSWRFLSDREILYLCKATNSI